jgi:hypothetical protein
MAFLKETERSLRAYFIVVGVLGTVLAVAELGKEGNQPATTTSMLVTLAVWFPLLARLVLGPMPIR